jgi:hypothetical protein
MAEIIIGDDTYNDLADIDGGMKGLVPRDMQAFPMGAFAPVANIPLIPYKYMPDLIREQEANKSRLSDILLRQNIPSMDQNDPRYRNPRDPRWGYCWMYGSVGALIAVRARMGLDYVDLSAFGPAYTMKNGRDEGGWGALSLDKLIKDGTGPESLWPEFEQKMRRPDDPFWVEAKKYRFTDGWMEIEDPVYNRDLSRHQQLSCLLNRVPVVSDYNWQEHCTYSCDVVDAFPNMDPNDPMRYGTRNRNSWGNRYGTLGFYILTGRKSYADNAVAPAVATAA